MRDKNEFPLNLSQLDIYFDQIKHSGNPLYNVGGYIRMPRVDVEKLSAMHRFLVESDDVFGLRIKTTPDGVVQYVSHRRNVDLHLIDFSEKEQAEEEAGLWLDNLFSQPFDIHEQELFKAFVLKINDESYWYVGFAHHLAMDGWGFSNWARRLGELYRVGTSETVASNNWQEIVQKDYDYLDSEKYCADRDYWLEQKELANEKLLAPFYHFNQDEIVPSERQILPVTPQQFRRISALAKEFSVGVAHIYLALFSCYFSKVHSQTAITFGLPFHGRKNHTQKNSLGVFVSVSPLLAKVSKDESFIDLVKSLAKQQKKNLRHQRYPIGHLISEMDLKSQDKSLYDIGFNYLKLDSSLQFDGTYADLVYLSHNHETTPLMITAWEYGERQDSEIQLDYNLAYFSKNEINCLLARFSHVLDQVLCKPEIPITQLSVLPPAESNYLIHELNDTKNDFSKDIHLHELFERQVVRTPNKIAIEFEGEKLTYLELNEASNRLAHYLRAQGHKAGSLVGICVDRSLDMMVGLYAILKAGGAYVPLDPSYPKARLDYLLEDSNISLLVTRSDVEVVSKLNLKNTRLLELDSLHVQEKVVECSGANISRNDEKSSTDLAYVIHTSGSTGKPKGVMIEHKAIVNFIYAMKDVLGDSLSHNSRVLAITTISFDIAGLELFGPLSFGGRVFISTKNDAVDPSRLTALMNTHEITFMQATPATWQSLVDIDWKGKSDLVALSGGEALTNKLANDLHVRCEQLINCYGPTEATVWSLVQSVEKNKEGDVVVDLGGPLANYQHYVLNTEQQIAPIGVAGELYIGGVGLARGYLNREELTEQKFVQSPFSDCTRDILYRTGDLVRNLPNGQLEFLGRIDDQVKVRGFRIELGEIENQLAHCENVASCAVVAQERGLGDKRLVAYVVVKTKTNKKKKIDESVFLTKLKETLQQSLPSYMLPSSILVLDKLPLTSNGKVDKKALPESGAISLQGDFIAPETETEKTLTNIWAKTLKLAPEDISITANFFDLGGHSLLAVRLIAEIRSQLKQEIPLEVFFKTSNIQQLSELVDAGSNTPLRMAVTAVEHVDRKLPLSFAQQRLWFIDQLQGGSTEYNMPAAMGIEGDFNIQAAEQAIANIIQRHEPLRTIFLEENDSPVQVVQKEFDFQLTQIDLRDIDGEKQAQKVKSLIQEHSHRAFDLSQELMVRGTYLHLAGEGESQEGILLFNMHHIASDGWSMGILVKEFISLYEAELAGQPDPLPALEIQYADYAHWQKHWLEGEVLDGQLDYWTKQLEEIPSVHSLPLDFIRPDNKQHQGEIVVGRLSPETSQALAQIANDNKVTLFMLLHAAIALVLSRHSHSQDIVLGTPVANRMQAELEPLIGFFVNTLVLRVNTEYDAFSDYLAHVKAINLEAQANQDVPFEHLVEHCKVARSTQHSPLFQIIFNMDTNEKSELSLPGIRISPVAGGETVAKFDLDINAVMSDDGLHFCWTYDKSLFKPKTIERLNDHLERVLMEVVDDPSLRLRDIAMLSEQEVHHLVHDLNDTQVDYPKDKLIHELFEGQAEETPDNIALVFNDEQLTYRELNEASNRLAHYLIAQGVTTETLVGLSVERSLTMVIGILGILKAGGAYVPLDPSYPTERLQYMLQDSDLHYLLTEQGLTDGLQLSDTLQLINYDADIFQTELSAYPLSNPERKEKQCSSNLAYIIYTSGSTGLPKGVMVEHGNVHRLFQATEAQFQFNSDDVWTLFHSYAFDFSVWELWGALLYGGRLVIVPWLTTRSSQAFYQLLHEQEVTILNQTPSAFQSLIEIDGEQTLPLKLRRVIFGGEALELASLKPWVARHGDDSPQLVNMYGITETTVHVTYRRLFKTEIEGPVSASLIGQPLSDLSVYLLTPELMLTPLGSVGELYVGGSGLSRGYLAKAELTAERFIQNPLSDEPNERLYKTGDLARYNANGELEFIGRIDDQVKIRGFRIELGEIEHHLSHCDNVASSLVLVREDESGEKYLVAYLIADNQETLDVNGLRQSLQATLPDYMLPAAFVVVKEWPLTANGKIDKKALPAPDGTSLQGEYIAPETQTEKTLVAIWAKLLHLPAENISVTANFFELGGHSLLTVRLIAEIRSQLKQELPLEDIFKSPDIQRLSMIVDAGSNVPLRKSVTKIVRSSHQLPLSFAQQRLWFIDQLQGGSAEYNMPMALRTEGDFDVSAAEQAIRTIIQRHEPLRTILVEDDEGPSQIIRTKFDFSLKRHDLRQLKSDAQDAKVQELVAADSVQAFNLSKDLMVRAAYLHLAGAGETQEGILLFNMHHIASDGWSMGILVKEFVAQYQAALAGHSDPLPALEIQYADYAHWQRDWLEGEVLEGQLNYWQQQLEDVPEVHALPLDRPRSELKQFSGNLLSKTLPAELSLAIQRKAIQEDVTPFVLLHAALALVLSRHSHSHDIVLGTPVANRMQVELEPLIGFFVNTLVLRVNTEFDTLSDYLAHVKSTNLDAQANQDVPFEQLVEHCKVARSTQHSPLFQIMFSMNTNEESELSLPGVNFSPVDSAGIVAKFDLDINAEFTDEGLRLQWTYDKSLFKHKTIDRLNSHLGNVLLEIVTKPDLSLRDIAMLSEQEIKHLTHELNDNQAEYPKDKLIHELFEAQVAKTPDNIALVFNDEQLTYRELNEASNRLAHYLNAQGVTSETPVGICIDRSLDMVIGILGILKSGGTYVPLDPSYPTERLQYMISDSSLKHLLIQKDLTEMLPLADEIELVKIDSKEVQQHIKNFSTNNLKYSGNQEASNLAYVIYTSGSTGQPKGVLVPHIGVVRLVVGSNFMELDQTTRFLQAAPISFDAATLELWGPLLNGGCCVVYSGSVLDFAKLNQTIIKNEVNSIWLTAGLFEQWSEVAGEAKSLRWILSGGDIVNPDAVNRVQNALQQVRLVNGYGPTENTTFSCCYSIPREAKAEVSIPIGSAINGTQLYVLSPNQSLVPTGCVGELWLGGDGLARGYLNQDDLTDERFIENPFESERSERLYRTGDLVRYLSDSEEQARNLEFIGRIDEQVKIRGHRVELGEIETQLVAQEIISSALIVTQTDESNQKYLVAYVIPENKESFELQLLKQRLQVILPHYMMPSAFIIMQEWPLTANGKIDKKSLPEFDGQSVQGEYIAPETETEITLTNIWSQLLKIKPEQISATANFFELGGHSLLTVRLIAEIRHQLKQELTVKMIFESPNLQVLAQTLDAGSRAQLRMPVTAIARDSDRLPTSFAQQRLWFIDQLQGGSAEYNMPIALRIKGDFNLPAAEQAIQTIIQRHESLRTIFTKQDGAPIQIIQPSFEFALKVHDLSQLEDTAQKEKANALIQADSIQAFDLSKDLMVRAAYLQLSTATENPQGILLFNMHHIASDGWSLDILVNEFIVQYQAALEGKSDPLPALDIQYADYAYWQRQWLEGDVLETQLSYWKEQLKDVPAVHGLPLDKPRPEMKTYAGEVITRDFSPQLSQGIMQRAQAEGVTPFMLLHAVLALVLSRHSNSHDIVIGTPVANRSQKELEPLIGFFLNTLVLRTNTQHDSLSDYLGHVKAVNLDAQANQDVSFEHLVEHCQVTRSTQYTPLFQILLNMNSAKDRALTIPGLQITAESGGDEVAKYDLVINATETDEGLSFSWIFDRSIFSLPHMQQLSEHFERLLGHIINSGEVQLSDLDMLSAEETHHLVHEVNATHVDSPEDKRLHELFESQATLTPDNVALIFENETMSYEELNDKANRLAHYLVEAGITPGTHVGVYLERSFELLIAVLAVMKSGGVYVALEPGYPQNRLSYMIDDGALELILLSSHLMEELPLQGVDVLLMDDACQTDWLDEFAAENLNIPVQSSDPIYTLYTSGSTGQPKGVQVTHGGVVNYLQHAQTHYLTADVVGSVVSSPLCFDATVTTLFTPLCVGKSVTLLVDNDEVLEELSARLFQSEQALLFKITPAHLDALEHHPLANEMSDVAHQIVVGGEQWTLASLRVWKGKLLPSACFVNEYGPTETVVGCSSFSVSEQAELEQLIGYAVPIGDAVQNVQLYVLNKQQQLQPAQSIGELYIGGDGVAKGYLNRAELTQERFVQSPFSDDANDRLYRTGDLVRYLPDDNGVPSQLEFIGRCDDQVKIRGFRIELGEIEYQLSNHPLVQSSVVLAKQDESGQNTLQAYVEVDDNELEAGALIGELQQSLINNLPEYMLPATFVIVDEWPLTTNGKIDKKILLEQNGSASHGEYVAPETETEKALVAIWARLLNLAPEEISVTSNFFLLGGHSLLATRLISSVREKYSLEIPLRALFDEPTIKGFAKKLYDSEDEYLLPPINVVERDESIALSYAQQRLWFIDQLEGGSSQYNLAGRFNLNGPLNEPAFRKAINCIIERHEVLRTNISTIEGLPRQDICSSFELPIDCDDISHLERHEQQSILQKLMQKEQVHEFDFSHDVLLRLRLVKLENHQHQVIFNMPHIASDGWSMNLLIKEFSRLYSAFNCGLENPLEPLEVQYADYASWQRDFLAGDIRNKQLSYWKTQLEGIAPLHGLLLDKPRPAQQSFAGFSWQQHLPSELSKKIEQLCQSQNVTLFMFLQTALSLLVSRYSDETDIVIGTPIAGRVHEDTESLIGLFVNTLVLRSDLSGNPKFKELLSRNKKMILDAYSNQHIPFEMLVEELKPERSLAYSPLFQIMLTLENYETERLECDDVELQVINNESMKAHFDLDLTVVENENSIGLTWKYNTDLFMESTIANMAKNFVTLLQGIVEGLDTEVECFVLTDKAERQKLLVDWNDTDIDYPSEQSLHGLFRQQVQETPNNIAVVYQESSLTYSQLDKLSNQWAQYLLSNNINSSTTVGIYLERSLNLSIALLAVLKAGARFVLLDTEYPETRLQYMLEDSGVKYLISESNRQDVVGNFPIDCLNMDIIDVTDILVDLKVLAEAEISSTACLFYTSGSSGKPKATLFSHQGLVNYSLAMIASLDCQAHDRMLQMASVSFDVVLEELLPVWFSGGTVVINHESGLLGVQELHSLLESQAISSFEISFAQWREWLVWMDINKRRPSESLRIIMVGCDSIPPHLMQQWTQYDIPLIHVYGLTETTITSSLWDSRQWDCNINKNIPAGRPIANTRFYVLDKYLEPQPIGVAGNLYVGGAGVSEGYLNQPNLTNERFLQNPFSDNPKDIVYNTGDRVRWLRDGNIEFIGRNDEQVKVRGFRVELGEIEYQLTSHELVSDAIVVAKPSKSGHLILVAYIIPKSDRVCSTTITEEIRKKLTASLPGYMIPSVFIELEKWPLTSNGKINRKALPETEFELNKKQKEYIAPRSKTECVLVDIWSHLLDIEPHLISVTSNFFELGGHSLLLMRLSVSIEEKTNIKVDLRQLFESSSVKEMAELIDFNESVNRIRLLKDVSELETERVEI